MQIAINNKQAKPLEKYSKIRLPLWLVKIYKYEYWPFWILFFPAIVYSLYLMLRARSATYFTAANPGIELGGFFGESKINILKNIPTNYLPVTLFFEENISAKNIKEKMQQHRINFPIICKPDKGERGYNVEKITSDTELENYLETSSGKIIVQEFITHQHELGILYYRFPDGSQSGITSIVQKEFLSVTGDGTSTVEELMQQSVRARFQIEATRKRLGEKIKKVLLPGEQLLLEPIGNHCRGTKFLNGNYLINQQLVNVFDTISKDISGFYFGRFDLKVASLEDLYEAKNICIMEVNGATSEPAHIYDPQMTLLKAQSDILFNTKLIYDIAVQNHKRGINYVPAWVVIKTVFQHFNNKKKHIG